MAKMVRVYDFVTKKVSTIPASELAPRMIEADVEGVGRVWIYPPDGIKLGPLRHPPFSEEVRQSLRQIQDGLQDVYPQTLEAWELGFRRDADPAEEIAIWLHITSVYERSTRGLNLSPQERRNYFRVVLACANSSQDNVLNVIDLSSISRSEAERVISMYYSPVPTEAVDSAGSDSPAELTVQEGPLTLAGSKKTAHESRMFQPRTPFLGMCDRWLTRLLKLASGTAFTVDASERLTTFLDVEFNEGVPVFNPTTASWYFRSKSKGVTRILISVLEDGTATLEERTQNEEEDNVLAIKCHLDSPRQIVELIETFRSLRPESVVRRAWFTQPLSAIVEGVYLMVPRDSRNRELYEWKCDLWKSTAPEWFAALCGDEFWGWSEFLSEQPLPESLGRAIPLSDDRDLLLSWNGNVPNLWHILTRSSFYWNVRYFVIRLREGHSAWFFQHYFSQTTEGVDLAKRMASEMFCLSRFVKKEQVLLPPKREEGRLAIEASASVLAFNEAHRAISGGTERAFQFTNLFARRIRLVDRLHKEHLDELEQVSSPLPLFLELPFRRFKRSEDPLEKISRGSRLLTLLCKIPVLLVAESLKHEPTAERTLSEFSNSLNAKPLSDGGWVNWHRRFASVNSNHKESLRQLVRHMNGELPPALNELVTARNRHAHPPNDHQGFLEKLHSTVPKVMDLMRSSMSECRVLIPKGLSFEGGRWIAIAQMLMGFDSELKTEKIVVQAPLESFPNDELILCDKNGSEPFKLNSYFRTRVRALESIDVGVFDRTENGRTRFTYLHVHDDSDDD